MTDRQDEALGHRSLLDRDDVIIVASVSCIYGLGSPEAYHGMLLCIERGVTLPREDVLKKLVEIQYERGDYDFARGHFRVRGTWWTFIRCTRRNEPFEFTSSAMSWNPSTRSTLSRAKRSAN